MNLRILLTDPSLSNRLKIRVLESGVMRTTKFWYKSVKKGRLANSLGLQPEDAVDFANKMDQMITLLNQYYPDAWDIVADVTAVSMSGGSSAAYTTLNNLAIIIRFPEIEITNSRNESHTIKDLFIVFPLVRNVNSKIILSRPKGLRGRRSHAENQSSYSHSHLMSIIESEARNFSYKEFCIGSGPLKTVFDTLEEEEMALEDFEAILILIEDFVKWESIEGVPYKYINDISEHNTRYHVENIPTHHFKSWCGAHLEKLVRNLKGKSNPSELNFVFNKDRIALVPSQKLQEVVKDTILEAGENVDKYIVRKADNNRYYGYTGQVNTNTDTRSDTAPKMIFRGEFLEYVIEDSSQEGFSIDTYEVLPVFYERLIKELNYIIYENAIRQSLITSETESNNNGDSLQEDSVSVSND